MPKRSGLRGGVGGDRGNLTPNRLGPPKLTSTANIRRRRFSVLLAAPRLDKEVSTARGKGKVGQLWKVHFLTTSQPPTWTPVFSTPISTPITLPSVPNSILTPTPLLSPPTLKTIRTHTRTRTRTRTFRSSLVLPLTTGRPSHHHASQSYRPTYDHQTSSAMNFHGTLKEDNSAFSPRTLSSRTSHKYTMKHWVDCRMRSTYDQLRCRMVEPQRATSVI